MKDETYCLVELQGDASQKFNRGQGKNSTGSSNMDSISPDRAVQGSQNQASCKSDGLLVQDLSTPVNIQKSVQKCSVATSDHPAAAKGDETGNVLATTCNSQTEETNSKLTGENIEEESDNVEQAAAPVENSFAVTCNDSHSGIQDAIFHSGNYNPAYSDDHSNQNHNISNSKPERDNLQLAQGNSNGRAKATSHFDETSPSKTSSTYENVANPDSRHDYLEVLPDNYNDDAAGSGHTNLSGDYSYAYAHIPPPNQSSNTQL